MNQDIIRSGDVGAPLLAVVRLFALGEGETRGVLYTAERRLPFAWDGNGVTFSVT